MHDGPGRHRGLPATGSTLISEGFGLQEPGTAVTAARADKPLRPTALEKVLDPDIASPVHHRRKDLTSMFLFCTQHLDTPDVQLGLVSMNIERATEDLEFAKRIIVREGYNLRRSLFRSYTWFCVVLGLPSISLGYLIFLAERSGMIAGYVIPEAYKVDLNAAIAVFWIAAG